MSRKHRWMPAVMVALGSVTWIGCAEDAAVSNGDNAWGGDLAYGPYAVGFRESALTRPGPEGTRSVALSIWYPAEASPAGVSMTTADYFTLALQEEQLDETHGLGEEEAFVAAMTGAPSALSADRAREGLDAPVAARLGAATAEGRFPLVLWSSRHATVLAQAPLAEVLASHGLVVATAWSSDPPLAFLWEERTATEKLETIEAHTDDLTHALEELRQDPLVDGENVVVVAWSYGGQTAARLQERDPGVRGVVAMDANVVPARPEESLDLIRPLVYLVGRDTSGRGFERLESLSAPWVAVRFPELAHGNFNALEGYLPSVLGTSTVYSWSLGGPVGRHGYRSLVEVVTSAARALTRQGPPAAEELAVALRQAASDATIEVFTSERR